MNVAHPRMLKGSRELHFVRAACGATHTLALTGSIMHLLITFRWCATTVFCLQFFFFSLQEAVVYILLVKEHLVPLAMETQRVIMFLPS